MKLAVISPIVHLQELSTLGDIQFALGHIKVQQYVDYYREQAKHTYTILDNGSYELGKSIGFDDYMQAAGYIQPAEIVAPDVQWSPDESYSLTKSFMNYLKNTGQRTKYKVMVVVWANGPGDFPDYYQKYLRLKPDVIGMGKWLSTKYLARPRLVKILKERGLWDYEKEHHFLGCAFPGEARLLAHEGRSMDTSGPIADAMNGLQYVEGEMYVELHKQSLGRSLDFNATLTLTQMFTAKANIDFMLRYAHGNINGQTM